MNKKNTKELFHRYEFKYVLDPVTAMGVRDFIHSIGLASDPDAPEGGYTVTSLYYDSAGLDDYYDKAGGFLDRKKLRVRIYGRDIGDCVATVNLEIKHKHDMFVAKERKRVPLSDWLAYVQGEHVKLFDTFDTHILSEGRVPTIVVRYEREAFEEQYFSRVRLTLDTDLEYVSGEGALSQAGDEHDTIPLLGSNAILEIKFEGELPWWFGLMVKRFNLGRTAFSKYAAALDAKHQYDPLPR